MEFVSVFGLGPNICDGCVAFKHEHCEAYMTENTLCIPSHKVANIGISNRRCAATPLRNHVTCVAHHTDQAYQSHRNPNHDKVRKESVSADHADREGWDGQNQNVHVFSTAVVNFFTEHVIDLLSYEEQIAAAYAQLHDPDRDIDDQFAPFIGYLVCDL